MTARAKISLLNLSDPEGSYHREILHCFCARENDWGYSNYISWKVVFSVLLEYTNDPTIS